MNKINLFLFIFYILLFGLTPISGQENNDSTFQIDDYAVLQDKDTIVSHDIPSNTYMQRHFYKNYKDKYTSDEFNYTEKPKKKGWLSRFFEWLSERESNQSSGSLAAILVWTFRILVSLIIIYGVYIAVSVLMGKEGAWIFAQKSDKIVLTYGIDEKELKSTDYEIFFNNACGLGDYRMAVRYRYLMLLQHLSSTGNIKYHPEKTNTDYSHEIKSRELSDLFIYLTYIYDHTWYGAFCISEHEFSKTISEFDRTSKMM